MLWGGYLGTFEVRATGGETRLSASFPYNREATLAEGRAEADPGDSPRATCEQCRLRTLAAPQAERQRSKP